MGTDYSANMEFCVPARTVAPSDQTRRGGNVGDRAALNSLSGCDSTTPEMQESSNVVIQNLGSNVDTDVSFVESTLIDETLLSVELDTQFDLELTAHNLPNISADILSTTHEANNGMLSVSTITIEDELPSTDLNNSKSDEQCFDSDRDCLVCLSNVGRHYCKCNAKCCDSCLQELYSMRFACPYCRSEDYLPPISVPVSQPGSNLVYVGFEEIDDHVYISRFIDGDDYYTEIPLIELDTRLTTWGELFTYSALFWQISAYTHIPSSRIHLSDELVIRYWNEVPYQQVVQLFALHPSLNGSNGEWTNADDMAVNVGPMLAAAKELDKQISKPGKRANIIHKHNKQNVGNIRNNLYRPRAPNKQATESYKEFLELERQQLLLSEKLQQAAVDAQNRSIDLNHDISVREIEQNREMVELAHEVDVDNHELRRRLANVQVDLLNEQLDDIRLEKVLRERTIQMKLLELDAPEPVVKLYNVSHDEVIFVTSKFHQEEAILPKFNFVYQFIEATIFFIALYWLLAHKCQVMQVYRNPCQYFSEHYLTSFGIDCDKHIPAYLKGSKHVPIFLRNFNVVACEDTVGFLDFTMILIILVLISFLLINFFYRVYYLLADHFFSKFRVGVLPKSNFDTPYARPSRHANTFGTWLNAPSKITTGNNESTVVHGNNAYNVRDGIYDGDILKRIGDDPTYSDNIDWFHFKKYNAYRDNIKHYPQIVDELCDEFGGCADNENLIHLIRDAAFRNKKTYLSDLLTVHRDARLVLQNSVWIAYQRISRLRYMSTLHCGASSISLGSITSEHL
jgi:hypothetical protein